MVKRGRLGVTGLLFAILLLVPPALAEEGRKAPFEVGYRTLDFTYTYPDGRQRMMTTAVWYPAHDAPAPYVYPATVQTERQGPLKTRLCVDAAPAAKDGPFPLVIFVHGAFGCAANSAFFTEYLASQGFVVAAADFEDTIPPDFTRQLAFGRLGEGNVAPPMLMLAAVGKFVKVFNEDREKCLWYMETFRHRPARFIIDRMLAMNKNEDSPLRGTMDENAIGIMGHSLGGLTSLGLIGSHPDPAMRDERIKAALIFSGPVYPYEENIKNIRIPLMEMHGDNDPNGLGPDYPRELLYERTSAPKFSITLKQANHFTFGNPSCDDLSMARESNGHVRVIQDYGAAFFERYLRNDLGAEERLRRRDDVQAFYRFEMEPGKEQVFGEKARGRGDGGTVGLKERIRDLRKSRNEPQERFENKKNTEDQPAAYRPSGTCKVKEIKDIAYYDGPDMDAKKHKLDLYLPEGKTGFPVLLFIHGGGWRQGDKDQFSGMYGKLGNAFAQEGIGTAVISYRLSPQVIHPEHVRDCARAFAWLYRHIEEYGGRKDRIFVTGQSAGGHLSALLAMDDKYLREQGLSSDNIVGVIPISGVYRIINNAFGAFGDDPAGWGDASPVNHARPNLPPFLIIVGDGDFRGAGLMANSLARALRAQGNAAEVIEIPDRTHITIITKVGSKGDQTTAEMLRFIRRRLAELDAK